MTRPHDFLPTGQFTVGCNYWASHAGTAMWRDWDATVVERDLEQIAAAGLQLLRVFPLWPDFQPLTLLRAGRGEPYEYRFGEAPLPDTAAGRAGVDEVMLQRFLDFADRAHARGLQLIVGLVTGWMSGRLFVPPAFANVEVLTDPAALMWQSRFVRHFVTAFRAHPAVLAWDLGNECNEMGRVTAEQAWVWTRAISGSVRDADPARPIVSGMHSLAVNARAPWSIRQQAELTDVLTTHPYPFWVPHVGADVIDSVRPILHAAAETTLYADVGGKPCFAEEIGSMGPAVASDRRSAQFLRASLYNLWARDGRAALWWCAYDQGQLAQAPYDWVSVERQLGLFTQDRRPKPVLGELSAFRQVVADHDIQLPPRTIEGVCVLSEGQDTWAVALNTFILANQAGFEVAFRAADQVLPAAPLYLLPSLTGVRAMPRRRWLDLLDRVRAGATLYLSLADATPSDLNEVAGLEVQGRERLSGPRSYTLQGETPLRLETASDLRLLFTPLDAEVLARDDDGHPVFTRCAYGQGTVLFLAVPLELDQAARPGGYERGPSAQGYRVYERLLRDTRHTRVARKASALVGATEHPLSPTTRVLVLVNHRDQRVDEHVALLPGWRLAEVRRGTARAADDGLDVELPAFDAAVLSLDREQARGAD